MVGHGAQIAKILKTTAGLDAEKPAELHLVGIEVFAVDSLCLKQQIIEGGLIERQGLFPRPGAVDVAGRSHRRRLVWCECHIPLPRSHGRTMRHQRASQHGPAVSFAKLKARKCRVLVQASSGLPVRRETPQFSAYRLDARVALLNDKSSKRPGSSERFAK